MVTLYKEVLAHRPDSVTAVNAIHTIEAEYPFARCTGLGTPATGGGYRA